SVAVPGEMKAQRAVDYADRAPISVAGIVTTLRVRTKKGEPMAWLVLPDGDRGSRTVFPIPYQKLNGPSILREGAFLVARGGWPARRPLASRHSWTSSYLSAGVALISAHLRLPSSKGATTCRHHRR